MLRPLLRLVAVVTLAAAIEIPYELCPDHPDLLGISSVRASPGSLHHGRMRFFVGLPLAHRFEKAKPVPERVTGGH